VTILAGDVGGTKTRLSLYERLGPSDRCTLERRALMDFDSRSAPSLEAIVREFLAAQHAAGRIEAACIGIPGAVVRGAVHTTNLPWRLDENALGEALGIPRIRLVNDHAATAAAIPFLRSEDVAVLHPGLDDRDRRCFAVLAPGTGLGQAMLYLDDMGRCHPFASEGGHVEFAPKDDLEFALLRYLQEKLQKRVSVERVLSGPGLMNIYAFLRDRRGSEEPPFLREELAAARQPAAVVTRHGMDGAFPICVEALEIFARLLGSQAGDVVLTYLCTGGLYLGGGIPPKLLLKLRDGATVRAYLTKGRLSPVVESTPLQVILDDRAALLGAASIAAALR
jgi:glucokinase